MTREDLLRSIENYTPFNEQEERDKVLILDWIRGNDNAFSRDNRVAHVTASAWVVNPDHSKVLMVYHNIYNSWSWLGGHADGDCDLLAVALREVQEESGIKKVRPVTSDIFSLESLTVDGHVKKGEYVSSHLHLNITYLLEADDEESVRVKEDENSGVAWFTPEEALLKSTEPWFVKHVYSKLVAKLHQMDGVACPEIEGKAENHAFSKEKSIIQAVIKVYFAAYYIDLTTDSFIELSSLNNVRRVLGMQGSARAGFPVMLDNYVHEDYVDKMRAFVDLDTLDQRMVDTDVISLQYIGMTYGWAQAYFIAGERQLNGRLKSVIYCVRNIGTEKKLEEERECRLLEAMEAAEAANLAKTAFLNNMSHDIRTPMNAILGYATLMEKELQHPEVLADYLGKIQGAGDFLLTIINNVLEIARIDSGKEEVDYEFLDVEEESKNFGTLFAGGLKDKHLTFETHMDIEHRYVFADISKTRQIMMNIVSNAIKYTPENGHIVLDYTELPSEDPDFAKHCIRLSDNGIGMSEEFLASLFDEFARERNTTESKIMGTGLGMAIVKKLVELLGGTIEVESTLGVGTTITIIGANRIVKNPEKYLEQTETAKITATQFKGKRILLAEDNELNAEIAKAILEDTGFFVDVASDGLVCVDMLRQSAPGYYDLIFMDVQMPNMDGYKATRVIRKLPDETKKHIPIIAMTANAFAEDKKKAFAAGMNGHLAKPIDVDELMKMLAEIFTYKYVET